MTITTDQGVRDQALQVPGSFIVQAPAGSGKTELLTQRFLKLLNAVSKPERVLAITFTRKATQEMRERIMLRLRQAAEGFVPAASHEKLAVQFAAKVLTRSAELGWDLMVNPARLQIHTIDGLCARISGRSPRPGEGVSGLSILDDARPLYRLAARRLIEDAGRQGAEAEFFDALSRVLVYLKGNATTLQDMLCSMLGRRDQWLHCLSLEPGDMADVLAGQQEIELKTLRDALGNGHLENLAQNLRLMAQSCTDRETGDQLLSVITNAEENPADQNLAVQVLFNMLKTVATGAGKPYSPRSVNSMVLTAPDGRSAAEVEAVKAILTEWNESEISTSAFARFVRNPPLAATHDALSVLGDFQLLLKYATAQLRVLFTEKGRSDFIYVAEMALLALGDELVPGDALLLEDGSLEHILLDEFQDTSMTQYELVSKLVSGWQVDDGRSLFLVGDPMQSIYRFRKADVALFNRVFKEGVLGSLRLQPLQLSSNFRSRPEVIDWVNEHFPKVFTKPSYFAPNFVCYTPVDAERRPGGEVQVHPFEDSIGANGEAELIADLVAMRLEEQPGVSIAVLARARVQLEVIARALHTLNLPFEAVQVEALGERQVIVDLLMILRAVMHPADRIAWLALLRAPWCALSPTDLILVAGESANDEILSRIANAGGFSELSPDKQARLQNLYEVMSDAVEARSRLALSRLVEVAWLRLGGPCAVSSRNELDNAALFFSLLDRVENDQPDDLLGSLEESMENFYSGSESSNVKLMTIHKAKGLEFDIVIIPGMQRGKHNADTPLIRIQEIEHGYGAGFLIAPKKRKDAGDPGLYDYLGLLENEQEAFESCRVLYVAATRARAELHLFGGWRWQNKEQRPTCNKGSFMDLLWAVFEPHIDAAGQGEHVPEPGDEVPLLPQLYLTAEPAAVIDAIEPGSAVVLPELRIPDPDIIALGQAFHSWMELIHDHWEQGWEPHWFDQNRGALMSTLRNSGATDGQLDELAGRLQAMIVSVLSDPRGRSLLDPEEKAGSWAEIEFLTRERTVIRRHIIDHLYCDSVGNYFVTDYKTGEGDGTSKSSWEAQLERYSDLLEAFTGSQPKESKIYSA